MEKKKVALLGETVVKEIYGERKFNPIGKYIKINRIDFQVIGVLPVKGSKEWGDQDDRVMIPLNTALHRVLGRNVLDYIEVQVKNGIDMNEVSEAVVKRLLFTHRMPSSSKDAVKVENMAEIQEA